MLQFNGWFLGLFFCCLFVFVFCKWNRHFFPSSQFHKLFCTILYPFNFHGFAISSFFIKRQGFICSSCKRFLRNVPWTQKWGSMVFWSASSSGSFSVKLGVTLKHVVVLSFASVIFDPLLRTIFNFNVKFGRTLWSLTYPWNQRPY